MKFKTGYFSNLCNFQSSHSIPCSQLYNVVLTFERKKESSHDKCGVRWWSNYGCIGYSSSKTEECINLKTILSLLKFKDVKGLSCNSILFKNLLINVDIPKTFNYEEKVKVLNYPFTQVNNNKFNGNQFDV